MKIRHVIVLVAIMCSGVGLFAAEKSVPTIMRTWQLDPWTGIADTLSMVDTSYMHLPMRDVLND